MGVKGWCVRAEERAIDRLALSRRLTWRALTWPLKLVLRNHPETLTRLYLLSQRVKAMVLPLRPAVQASAEECVDLKKPTLPFGVNVSGYLAGEFGIAEASRGLVHALQAADIPYALRNILVDNKRYEDRTFTTFTEDNPYTVNLVTVNADMVLPTREVLGASYFADRFNIGVWYWELSQFPEMFWPSFAPFQEIWVTSAFCAEAIARVSSIPVVKITQPTFLDESRIVPDRQRFGIPPDACAFQFSFDFHSFMERKNPLGVIEAFQKAFGNERAARKAVLVLKSINGGMYPDLVARLKSAAAGLNVLFLDDYLSRDETLSLLSCCDCLVSLHRSEGLGLGMAEAMYLGKPVIATAYSGNMDFMTVNNSFLVKYRLVELEQDYGPYQKGNVWAEPDLNHAAELMRYVYENREEAVAVGRRAAHDMKTQRNPAVTGREIRARLRRALPELSI